MYCFSRSESERDKRKFYMYASWAHFIGERVVVRRGNSNQGTYTGDISETGERTRNGLEEPEDAKSLAAGMTGAVKASWDRGGREVKCHGRVGVAPGMGMEDSSRDEEG